MISNGSAGSADSVRFGALRHRKFVIFWIGLLISHTGTWIQIVGQGWLVYDMTNTPVWLGLTNLAFAVPMIVLPLFGGAVADRVNRLRLMRGLQAVAAAAALVLTLVTYLGVVQAWHLAAFSLVQGLVLAFDGPARHATVPHLVDSTNLLGAVSLAQSTYPIGGFFGPAVAGVLLGWLGTERIYILFGVNVFTFLAFLVALSMLGDVPQERAVPASLLGSVVDGLRFVWDRTPLRALLVVITVSGVFGRSYLALMPAFARDVLGTDARGLGFLTAAPGVGVVIGAAGLSAVGGLRHQGRAIATAALAFAVVLAAFAASRAFAVSLATLVVLGFATVTLVATMSAAMQAASPDRLRGRVMSLWAIANVGLPSLGAMLTASAAAMIGVSTAVMAGAGLVLIVALVLRRRLEAIGSA
ncbi:MAG: MFS transporter [Armatimonadota bacterium]|nr:MFS transporter [Armatimonadota bacterium]